MALLTGWVPTDESVGYCRSSLAGLSADIDEAWQFAKRGPNAKAPRRGDANALMATFREMENLGSETQATVWALKNKDRMFPHRDVQGLVRFGIDLKDRDRRRYAKLLSDPVSDFIILDEGTRPELGKSLGCLVAGTVLLIAVVAWMRPHREPDAADTY